MAEGRIFEENVLGLEVSVADVLSMHLFQAVKNLSGVVLDVRHRNGTLFLFSLAQLFLKAFLAVLHNEVLNQALLIVERVEKLDELHDVGCPLEQRHDLVLS